MRSDKIFNFIKSKKLIFWDFDGVIKDSNKIKNDSFITVLNFRNNKQIKKKISNHHSNNLGMSRYKKIPLYLKWSNQKYSQRKINNIYKNLSVTLQDNVSKSPWVKGVFKYIKQNYKKQKFVLITATPQDEIEIILKRINLFKNFQEIYGYPHKKSKIINTSIKSYNFPKKNTLFIGDSKNDYNAAKKNDIHFILRKTKDNTNLQKIHRGYSLYNFNE